MNNVVKFPKTKIYRHTLTASAIDGVKVMISRDVLLGKVRRCIKASQNHELFINRSDSAYDKTDISREHGYQEAFTLVESWLRGHNV